MDNSALSRTKARWGHLTWTPLRDITIGDRMRKDLGKIPELMESIQRTGLIHPLVVAKGEGEGKVLLVSGERRLTALTMLGWSSAPTSLPDQLSPMELRLAELEENIYVKPMHWLEEAAARSEIDKCRREMMGDKGVGSKGPGWTQENTAALLGVTRGEVSLDLKITRIVRERPDIKERIAHLPRTVALKAAEKILRVEETESQVRRGILSLSSSLRHGPAEELIKDIKSGSVSLVLTDPPFGIQGLEEERGKARASVKSYTAQLKEGDNLTLEGSLAILTELMPEVYRTLRPSGHFYFFCCMDLLFPLVALMREVGLEPSIVPLIWDKGRTTSPFTGYNYAPCYEPIVFGYKPPRTRKLNKPGRTILPYSPVSVKGRAHVFEKPIPLLSFLISQSTQKGEMVLDPFAGSASTLLAARDLGRSGMGFEVDREHFMVGQERLRETSNE